jgi:hypothetical protein
MSRNRKNNGGTGAATKEPPAGGFDPQRDSAAATAASNNATAASSTATTSAAESPSAAAKGDQPLAKAVLTVLLEAPMGHVEGGYATNSINYQGMTQRQSAAAKRLFISLGRENARIQMNGIGHPDGKVVNTYGDAVRWLFEQLADKYEEETGRKVTEGLVF